MNTKWRIDWWKTSKSRLAFINFPNSDSFWLMIYGIKIIRFWYIVLIFSIFIYICKYTFFLNYGSFNILNFIKHRFIFSTFAMRVWFYASLIFIFSIFIKYFIAFFIFTDINLSLLISIFSFFKIFSDISGRKNYIK